MKREVAMGLVPERSHEHSGIVSFQDSVRLLQRFHIPLTPSHLVSTLREAKTVALGFGFPVVMKLISSLHLHKTESGAVLTNVKSQHDLERAYRKLIALDPHAEGVLVQQQLSGVELFAGLHHDPVFGPVVGFGLGGVLVEVARDVHFAVCPLEPQDADRIILQSTAASLLTGYRGQKLVSLSDVRALLLNLSRLAQEFPGLSLDLNPLFISQGKLLATDWRVLHA